MTQEKYSQEAFEENEKKIDEVRDLARQKPFSGRADPADIMSAKFSYSAGKQKREELKDLAHEEALKEDTLHPKNSNEKKLSKVGDFVRIALETESGNKYLIQKTPDGKGYLVANFNAGTIDFTSSEQIENSELKIGKELLLGDGAHTSAIKSARGQK